MRRILSLWLSGCCVLFAVDANAQAGGDTEVEGFLKKITVRDGNKETTHFVLIADDHQYRLDFPSHAWRVEFGRLEGRGLRVKGFLVTSAKEEIGQTTIRITSFSVTRRFAEEQKIAIAKREAANKKRFESEHIPLSAVEKQAALAEFGVDSPILDGELRLRHSLHITVHGEGCIRWEFQPDRTFEKYLFMRSTDRGGETRRHTLGKGKLSTRQTVELARLMERNDVLDLPEKIDDGVQIEPDSGRSDRGAYRIDFGDFACVGGRARSASNEREAIQKQQARLSAVASSFTRTGSNNLRFQDPDSRKHSR